MYDEDLAAELLALHDDATSALTATDSTEPADMVGPIVLVNGMWANRHRGWWRVTFDREGLDPIGRLSRTLDECRRHAAVVGPHELSNNMFATFRNGFWWLTRDRRGVDPVGRRCSFSLDECRRWAEELTPKPQCKAENA